MTLSSVAALQANSASASPLYLSIYPAVEQMLVSAVIFPGDRYGLFNGDYVSQLSDGSEWKVHPNGRDVYAGGLLEI